MNRELFITLEGGEGGGKSTQAKLLRDDLTARGHRILLTREPGGSPGAEAIRRLLVEGEAARWDGLTEALLHFAARRDHVTKTIQPALTDGQVVISDRFVDSTIAYQGYGHGVALASLAALRQAAIGDFAPDLTLILDLPAEIGLARAKARRDGENRYESMDLLFHQRLREGFLTIARHEPRRCRIVDATQPIAAVQAEILKAAMSAIAQVKVG